MSAEPIDPKNPSKVKFHASTEAQRKRVIDMKTKNVIRNTTAEAKFTPDTALAAMAVLGVSAAIESSESRGQDELVRSAVLPSKMSPKDRSLLEANGVVFGDPVDGDDMFVHVTLPLGWMKRPTDHAMWSDLVDEKGRKRAAIFYKAAFYDRSADLTMVTRHRLEAEIPPHGSDEDKRWARRYRAMVDDVVLFDTGWVEPPAGRKWETPAFDAAEAWLNEHRPGWKDPALYWDALPTPAEGA